MTAQPSPRPTWVDGLAPLARTLLSAAGADPGALRLEQLRRKPGAGAVARLRVAAGRPPRRGEAAATRVWLGVDEAGLDRLTAGTAGTADVRVHGFGTDPRLPALAEACAPAPGGEVWGALEAAAGMLLGGAPALAAVDAVPVRYKPGSRCVLRYTLHLRGGAAVAVFGKLFAEPRRAIALDAVSGHLHEAQRAGDLPVVLARPLGVSPGAGLALTAEGAEGDGGSGPLTPGTRMLLAPRRGTGTRPIPATALAAAGEALARLHGSATPPLSLVHRTGAHEGARALGRARLIAEFAPASGPRLMAAATELARLLGSTGTAAEVTAHGGFKPSQLVYAAAGRVVLTDLDGLCLADPALDLGYFLAYLRPIGAAGGRGAAAWYASAASCFLDAYARSMAGAGVPRERLEAALREARLYEAALLLKIAARRPQRLNAPRAGELEATAAAIEECLTPLRRVA
ncbi:MAG TPA: phosphotransferase [Candidatus Dormibacteraeota bacterium]|nr:phosphotransferase [Candidatus Dormibacteraeota bacterium]